MIGGNPDARQYVDDAVLLRKAPSWRYEKEWRLIGRRGLHESPLELEEIIFGMRCKESVKYAVVTALGARSRPVSFFEMREVVGTFKLRKCALEESELKAFFPRRSRDTKEAFEAAASGQSNLG